MSTIKVNNIVPPNVGEGVSIDGLQMPTAGALSNRNLIINGAMTVAQRTASATAKTTADYYSVDRYKSILNTLGTWTVSQEADAPAGFKYSLKHTCTTADSSPATTDYALIYHSIESQNIVPQIGYGTSSAKNLTLSFWVKSNKTGNASCGIHYSIGAAGNLHKTVQYAISSANTWEYKTVTFSPNSVANAAADNGAGITVEWWMNSGSDYSGTAATGWVADGPSRNSSNIGVGGAVNDYFQITGVQLEVGSKATPFEHRSYGDELQRCQRYFQLLQHGSGVGLGTTNIARCTWPLRTTMRSPVTIAAVGTPGWFYGSAGATFSALGTNYSIPEMAQMDVSVTGGAAGAACFSDSGATSYFTASAEF